LPDLHDHDFQQLSLTAHLENKKKLPSFISFDNETRTFFFMPVQEEHLGKHNIVLELTDLICKPIIYEF